MNPTHTLISEFKTKYKLFQLGELPTESCNPLSTGLSHLSQTNLPKAIDSLKKIDLLALKVLLSHTKQIEDLSIDILSTLEQGNRIFLFGCGATGRLSISLEFFCRTGLVLEKYKDQIIGFMSGGDLALIRSIEKFEDYPLYGSNHLMDLVFKEGDLLISTTEGGETPIVIGATEKASEISSKKPYFLYCNPDEILIKKVERSKNVIMNPKINKISLDIGAMALSGSTRMQASTVLMLFVGTAFESITNKEPVQKIIEKIIDFYEKLDLNPLRKFIELEASLYKSGEYLIYLTSQNFGVTILTDTTERSPTFTLNCFENVLNDKDKMCLSYICLKNCKKSEDAWRSLLNREPRTLEWEFCKALTDYKRLMGYDISEIIIEIRKGKNKNQNLFIIDWDENQKNFIGFQLLDEKWGILCKNLNSFQSNLVLKMVLNIHSTLVMGRLERYESNVMTYVKPSNYKLIDRSIRYIRQILKEKLQKEIDYEEVLEGLEEAAKDLKEEEPFVLKACNFFIDKKNV